MAKNIQVGLSLFLLAFGLSSWVYAAEQTMDPDHAYNQGVDFYHKLDYNKSADSFSQSMNTQDKHLEQWAAYNLGSAFFNQAQAAEQSDPGAVNQIYQKALNFFKQAIEIDPTDKAAKYNYELAAKKIIEQKQKSKQNQPQDKQDKQDNQGKQDKQDKQNQENKPENQEQKDQKDKQENKENKENKEPDASSAPESEQKQAQQSAGQNEQHRQMTQEEAKMLLENFQKAEDQKKAMDLQKAQQQTSSGGKDW